MRKVILISADETVVHLLTTNALLLNIDLQVVACSGDLLREIKLRSPELLIVDFILNDDNGGALCHQVKLDTQLHDLPVILLSEYTSLDPIAPKFGCNIVITKPLNISELQGAIGNLLQSQAVH